MADLDCDGLWEQSQTNYRSVFAVSLERARPTGSIRLKRSTQRIGFHSAVVAVVHAKPYYHWKRLCSLNVKQNFSDNGILNILISY